MPWVSVPVLSKANVFTRASLSNADPFLTIIPCFAARLIPLTSAIGAPSRSGQGVATTITCKKRIQSPPEIKNAAPAIVKAIAVKTTL